MKLSRVNLPFHFQKRNFASKPSSCGTRELQHRDEQQQGDGRKKEILQSRRRKEASGSTTSKRPGARVIKH